MLTLEHLNLDRGGRRVLEDIYATAAVGQLTALLGPNGAGKSSLLSVAAGELKPSAGSCTFADLSIPDTPPQVLARRRAMLPQQSPLDFDFTVLDIARMGATPFPEIPSAELDNLCTSILHLTDALPVAQRRYPTLSGGERQRVQIARVLVQACAAAALGPALLLLDEPTASLDPRHQHLLLAGLHELCRSVPLAIVASVHDINLALDYADAAWLMNQGKLVAAGPPATTLTADLLSQVFQLPVRMVEQHATFTLPHRS
jgi:iron complex transport system ATP-binding protein